MKNKTETPAEEVDAINEAPVSACELLDEIGPLLIDYFLGSFLRVENGITYRLPNGQKFIITAKEVKA